MLILGVSLSEPHPNWYYEKTLYLCMFVYMKRYIIHLFFAQVHFVYCLLFCFAMCVHVCIGCHIHLYHSEGGQTKQFTSELGRPPNISRTTEIYSETGYSTTTTFTSSWASSCESVLQVLPSLQSWSSLYWCERTSSCDPAYRCDSFIPRLPDLFNVHENWRGAWDPMSRAWRRPIY